jgi:hypothetical protein
MKALLDTAWFEYASARLPRLMLLAGLALLICGAKFWLINTFGNATPYWDEWISEVKMIKAYLDGTSSAALYFQSHNEHRILYTQIFFMLLFRMNGKWDPILQMVAQAPLHAIVVVTFVRLVGKFMSGVGNAALAGFAGCLGILPFGLENTLWGDQSCFYFSILFALVVIWLCWRYEALTFFWWLGALLGIAGLFALASGTFTILSVIAFLAARLIHEGGKAWKRRIAGIALFTAIAIFGVLITPHITVPNKLVATNFKDFFGALTGILSWPSGFHWACIVVQAPLILLAISSLVRRVSFTDGRWFVITVGSCFWIQAIATAYRRCQGWDASRYCDSWSMLLMVNFSCLYFLGRDFSRRSPFLILPIAAAWLFVCVYGAIDSVVNVLPHQLTDRYYSMLEMENNVREYLNIGNPVWLQRKIPYGFPAVLQEILDQKSIRGVLPSNLVSFTPPLAPDSQTSSGGGFVKGGRSSRTPILDKEVIGSFGKTAAQSKSGISLFFKVPRGTREVSLQVAGYPHTEGIALHVQERRRRIRSIAPALDPGDNWQTISVRLEPDTTSFKISATDKSTGGWIAFSMPTVSTGGFPGRWARSLTSGSFILIDSGIVLLLLGILAEVANRESASNPFNQSLEC